MHEIDTIARRSINQRISDRDDIISSSNMIPIETGKLDKLRKELAPTREINDDGTYANRYNMSDMYVAYRGEGLVKFSTDKHTEAMIRNGYYIASKNSTVVKYLNQRFTEIEIVSRTPFSEFIRDFGVSTCLYGNGYIVKHRQLNASSGRRYTRWDGKKLNPIASLYMEDSRKMLLGEGPAGKMRYVRLPVDVSTVRHNTLNPALFDMTKAQLYGDKIALYSGRYSLQFSKVLSKIFNYSYKRDREYLVYDDEEISHVRYHHIPGEKISMPPFWPVLNDIDTLRRIEENIELLVFSAGHPILHGTIGDNIKPGSAEEVARLTTKLSDMESNGFIVTDNRSMLKYIGAEGEALRIDAYLQYFHRRVLTGLWLSEVAIGIGDTSNRATSYILDKISQEKVLELQSIFSCAMKYIMIEMLMEAGANIAWILKPENLPSFVFNPVDIEGKIAKESHVLNMWQANMLSEDEMRIDIGREKMTPKERQSTYVNTVSIPLKEAGPSDGIDAGKSASNKTKQQKTQPTNQYGTKKVPSPAKNDSNSDSDILNI